MADESKSRYSNTWSGDEFLGEVQRVLIERGLTPPEWPSRTPTERDFAINSCAGWCEDRLREVAALKAELASVRSEQQPLRSALKLAQDWIEKEEGESMQQILQKEGQFNELGRHCYNSQFVAVCRAVTAALAQSNERN